MSKSYKSPGSFAGSWEVRVQAPLDDRQNVDYVSDLTNDLTWKSSDGSYYHYEGMPVCCLEDKNMYMYIGATGSGTDVKDSTKWKLLSGGGSNYKFVLTKAERDAIPSDKLEEGCVVYVKADNKEYRWIDDVWIIASNNDITGYPVLTQEDYNKLETKPEKWVDIPDPYLEGSVENRIITTQENGDYLNVIFNTLRELQTEVARIKNTFNKGIISYNGTYESASNVITEDEEETEPLWAIDPDTCTLAEDASITIGTGAEIGTYDQDKGEVVVSSNTYTIPSFREDEEYSIMYMRVVPASDSKIVVQLSPFKTIDITNLIKEYNVIQKTINIIFVLKTNKNLIYFSCTTDQNVILKQGYIDDSNKYQVYESDSYLTNSYNFSSLQLKNVNLKLCNFYTKTATYTNTSGVIIPPNNDDFTLKVAHLTIRSVSNEQVVKKNIARFLKNELILIEDTNEFCIILKNNKYVKFGGGEVLNGEWDPDDPYYPDDPDANDDPVTPDNPDNPDEPTGPSITINDDVATIEGVVVDGMLIITSGNVSTDGILEMANSSSNVTYVSEDTLVTTSGAISNDVIIISNGSVNDDTLQISSSKNNSANIDNSDNDVVVLSSAVIENGDTLVIDQETLNKLFNL